MLTFVNSLFLFAAAGLALPVIIHLLRRQRAKQITFPSIRFILKGKLPNTGRRRLRDIPLLFLRLLLLLLLILAFARPELHLETSPEDSKATPGDKPQKKAVIVLDTSVSMQGVNKFSKAKTRIRNILKKREGTDFGLILSSRTPRVILRCKDFSPQRLKNELEKAEPTVFAGRHEKALRKAAGMLDSFSSGEVFLVSDFQKTDWTLNGSQKIFTSEKLHFEDVAPDTGNNCGITGTTVRQLGDKTKRVIVDLKNFGTEAQERMLRLTANEEAMTEEKTVKIPAKQTVKASLLVKDGEARKAVVSLRKDGYKPDDRYHTWLGEIPPIQLPLIAPLNKNPQKKEEVFFLKKALSVDTKQFSGNYKVREIATEFFFSLDPESFDGLILAGAAGYFSVKDFNKLKTFLTQGGVALCTPGRAVSNLFSNLQQHNLLDAQYLEVEEAREETTHVGWIKKDTSLYDIFGDKQGDLFVFPIQRYARLETGEKAEVLLKADNGAPLLLRQKVGNGHLYLSAFAFDTRWSAFPVSGSFVPLLREIFTPSDIRDGSPVKNVVCGERMPLPKDLMGREQKIPKSRLSTDEPDVRVIKDQPYEINISRKESSQPSRSLIGLRRQLSGNSEKPANIRQEQQEETPEQKRAIPLWPWFAVAAALLLPAELVLATFRGRANNTSGTS